MYDKTEIRILEQIYLNPGIHKRELSKQLKLGMPSIDYGLKKISKLIKQKKVGNQINYFLDYSKEMLSSALGTVEHSRFERLPAKVRLSVNDFLKELKNKPVIALIFGLLMRFAPMIGFPPYNPLAVHPFYRISTIIVFLNLI